jgi:hypothetical protein
MDNPGASAPPSGPEGSSAPSGSVTAVVIHADGSRTEVQPGGVLAHILAFFKGVASA